MKNLKTDLKKVTIADVANVVTGKTPPTSRSEYYGGPFLFVAPGDLGRHKYVRHSEKTLTADGIHYTPSIPKGSILFTCIGSTIGKIGIAGENLSTNQQINSVIPKDVDPEYLYYILDRLGKRIKRNAGVQAIPIVTKSEFESQHLLIHHDAETQKRISDLLSVWDIAIEKTEALIAAKERQFQELAKRLICVPSSNWSTHALKDISKIKKGQQLNRVTLNGIGQFPVWNGGISPSGFTNKYNTLANTITISEGGNSCGFVNYCKENFWLGGHCYSLEEINPELLPEFLFFLLKYQERRIMRLRVGSGLPNIQKKDIGRFDIRYPALNIQKKIADALNIARHEIELIKNLAAQYRLQKCGLMQQLLTEKWRIKK